MNIMDDSGYSLVCTLTGHVLGLWNWTANQGPIFYSTWWTWCLAPQLMSKFSDLKKQRIICQRNVRLHRVSENYILFWWTGGTGDFVFCSKVRQSRLRVTHVIRYSISLRTAWKCWKIRVRVYLKTCRKHGFFQESKFRSFSFTYEIRLDPT